MRSGIYPHPHPPFIEMRVHQKGMGGGTVPSSVPFRLPSPLCPHTAFPRAPGSRSTAGSRWTRGSRRPSPTCTPSATSSAAACPGPPVWWVPGMISFGPQLLARPQPTNAPVTFFPLVVEAGSEVPYFLERASECITTNHTRRFLAMDSDGFTK